VNTISSNNSNPSYTQSSSSGSTTKSSASDTNSASSGLADSTSEKSDINLSTRSQKIQKLNEEFFPSGPQSIKITSAFITRLHEYGLITEAEANSLSPSTDSTQGETTNSLGELSLFIERFNQELEEQDPNNPLIDTLEKSHSIIEAWESTNPASMEKLNEVMAEMATFNGSEAFEALEIEDQKSMLELELAMNVAEKLNPAGNVSQKINSYLNILNGSR